MALQCKWSNTFQGQKEELILTLKPISISVANNTTTLEYTFKHYSSVAYPNSTPVGYTIGIDEYVTGGRCDFQIAAGATEILTSGQVTINHNNDGTKLLNFYFNMEWGYSANGSGYLPQIARPVTISYAPTFYDDDTEIKIGCYAATLSMLDDIQTAIMLKRTGAVLSSYIHTDINNGEIVLNGFSDSALALLYADIPTKNSTEVEIRVKSIINGIDYIETATAVVNIRGGAPTFAYIIEDGNTATAALTGNINSFIKYHSQAVYNIGATAHKGASIVEQWIECGTKKNTSPLGSLENIDGDFFKLYAKDSRGRASSLEVEKNIIDYFKPTINANADAPTSVQDMRVTLKGNCFNESFGAKANTIKLYYRYAAVNYNYGAWVAVNDFDIIDNEFTAIISLTDIDYQLGYNFEARITDSLNDVVSAEIRIKTKPVFDWSAEDFNFNVPVNMKVGHIDYNLYGLARAMTQAFNFDCLTIAGNNYSTADVSASLVGNCLRCNLKATRSAATGGALVTNEKVCEVTIYHDEKIAGMLNISFGNGSTGGVASFYTTEVSQTAESLTFSIYAASTAQSDTSFNTFFIVPVTINLNKFID